MPCDYRKICQDNIRRRGEEFDDIGQLIAEQLYSDRSHFVYELLQNAEDALERRFRQNPNDRSPCKVQFRLFQDRLEFRHFGALFNEEDVRGIDQNRVNLLDWAIKHYCPGYDQWVKDFKSS